MPTPSPAPSSSRDNTICPQRKHRKLLKDGSGSEVWPESLERLFLEGLRQYWNSPWATYSRGRSRWRNQFLVDFLANAGIIRTKKQVASHIQVLRNMLRGRPEFALVAGADEPNEVPTTTSGRAPSIKAEDAAALLTLDTSDNESMSNSSFSPTSSMSSPITDMRPKTLSLPATEYSPDIYMSFPSLHGETPSSPDTSSLGYLSSPASISSTSSLPPPSYPRWESGGGQWQDDRHVSQSTASPSSFRPPPDTHSRATFLSVTAEGMTPFQVHLDSLNPPSQPTEAWNPSMLRMRVAMPSIEDVRCSSTLHGLSASVTLSNVWKRSATCITRTFTGGVPIDERSSALQPLSVDSGAVNADLPDSWLSRCRWLDAGRPSYITQQVIVDGRPVLFLVFDLDRNAGSYLPSVALASYSRKQPSSTKPVSTRMSPTSSHHPPTMPTFTYQQHMSPTSPSGGSMAPWTYPMSA